MYTPLFIKTDYSLLSSLIKIDDLIELLLKNNIFSCAICDDNLFGVMEFYKKCKNKNIKPIIGLEISIDDNPTILISQNYNGYKNLIKIETIKNTSELTIDILKKYNKDIICIVLNQDTFSEFKNIYKTIYIGVSNKEEENNAFKITNNVVYINRTLYLEKYDYRYLPYLYMIRDGKTIKDQINYSYVNNYLYNDKEIKSLNLKTTTISNTLEISNICNIDIPKNLYMPTYGVDNPKEFLTALSNKGLTKRLNKNIPKIYQDRLNYELDTIINMHFEDYFLVVYDYIKYAKKNGILVGPGRGSAAGSLVSYSLGITNVDPIKYNLLFERFLNPQRITMPDIDTDFEDQERDRVIEYVKNKYGTSNVAGIITFGTLGAKQAVRDVGRVLMLKTQDIDYIAKKVSSNETIKEARKHSKELEEFLKSDELYIKLYDIITKIEKNKRHTSIHAAGIVISREILSNVLPIYKNSDNLYLTEYTMEYLEELGLIKMDFLGIKNLSIIKGIIKDIEKYENIKIDINNIDLNDKKVIDIFKYADTIGIFQFESEGMKRFLTEFAPQNFNDICAAIALFRPGPASNIPTYINRAHGKEKITYPDDSLIPILEETYGIIVYQEQIMQIASKMASYTLGEADILRRAMSKKKYEILKNEEQKFISNSIKNGYDEQVSKNVYELILKFADYGFNKSHSVSYALVSYQMAFLKAYFPKYFYSNLLSRVVGSEIKTLEYINEIKKIDIKIFPPDINESDVSNYIVNNNGIIFPLSSIRNVGLIVSNIIVNERKKGKFVDIFDFLKRTYKNINNKKVLESLIYGHSFDKFLNINTLINNLDEIINYIDLTSNLEDNIIPKPEIELLEEYYVDDVLEKEKQIFGFYVTSHKTERFKAQNPNIIDISEIKNKISKIVTIVINIDYKKEITTKKGDLMCFLKGSDSTGTISVTIFPKIYKDYIKIKKDDIIIIVGNVEKRLNEYSVIAKEIKLS